MTTIKKSPVAGIMTVADMMQPKDLIVLENPSIKTLVAKAIQHLKKQQHA